MRKEKVPSKLCVRCGKVLPLTDFYPNKLWKAQRGRDAWCRECAAKYCKDKETLMEYCNDNNRLWKDTFWDSANKKAQYILATDPDFLSSSVSKKRKEELEGKTTCRQFFSMMNLGPFYTFVDRVGGDGTFVIQAKEPIVEEDGSQQKYNRKWAGNYTDEQIEILEEKYSQYEEDFVLDNVNIRDYARKVCKASLNADIAEDKMRRGMISVGEYKETQKIFDDLSKSSNFAACRRKPGEASGMGSLGEIIVRLEVDGKLNKNGFHFPPDDIDKIITDLKHTFKAVGIEGQL